MGWNSIKHEYKCWWNHIFDPICHCHSWIPDLQKQLSMKSPPGCPSTRYFQPNSFKRGSFLFLLLSGKAGYRFHHPASPPSEHLSCHLDTPSSSLYIHSHSQCPGLDLCHLSWMVRASQQPLQFVLIWRLLAKLEQTEIETSIKKVSKQREGWGQCRAENKELPSDFQWKFGYWSMFEAEDVDV